MIRQHLAERRGTDRPFAGLCHAILELPADPELAREEIRATDLVANPGCYPTTAQLPLRPLLEAGLIELDPIIIDAKSGVTGAGRAAKEASLHSEVSEGLHAYGVANHRHAPGAATTRPGAP